MPAYDIDSQSPGGSFEPQPDDGWSMPLGAIAGIRLFVSYSVFVALAVLAGVVAMVQGREGNSDLPIVTLTAVVIWGFGWGVQFLVHVGLHFGTHAKSETITIGLLGIEAANPLYRRHPWSAVSNLMAACFSMTALVLFGAVCLAVHMLTRTVDYSDWSLWLGELSAPSFGMDAVDNCYLTAAWLFWIQAACQAYPLPRNLGRGALASTIVLFDGESGDPMQVKLLRRSLQLIAVITIMVAMATMIADAEVYLPRWQILFLLAIYLWVSAGKDDLRDWVASIHLAGADPIAGHFEPALTRQGDQEHRSHASSDTAGTLGGAPRPVASSKTSTNPGSTATPWISEMVDSVRMRQKRKRARAAMRREHEEASDAARLDHVLKIVSEHGTDGLSHDDRALLQRVSANLRRNRESKQSSSADSDD